MWRLLVLALVLAWPVAPARAQVLSIEIVKRPPELVLAGEHLTFPCRVKNTSAAPIEKLQVSVRQSPTLSLSKSLLLPDVTKLDPGDSTDLRLELEAVRRGQATIDVAASAQHVDEATASAALSVGAAMPELPAW